MFLFLFINSTSFEMLNFSDLLNAPEDVVTSRLLLHAGDAGGRVPAPAPPIRSAPSRFFLRFAAISRSPFHSLFSRSRVAGPFPSAASPLSGDPPLREIRILCSSFGK